MDEDLARDPAVDPSLLRELAQVVHGPTAPAAKVRWVLDTARAETGAQLAAYCPPEESALVLQVAGSGTILDLRSAEVRSRLRRSTGELEVARPQARRAASVLVVVVPSEAGTDLGVLVLAHQEPDRLGDGAEALAVALAAHLGAALGTAATLEHLRETGATQQEVVHQLQDAVRPPMPAVAHAELGVCYEAADPAEPTGGDLYDWQPLPDGGLHVAVVDVMGKGVAATKDALTLTHGLRMLALEGVDVAELGPRVREIMADHAPDLVATFVVGRYSPDTGELTLAGAGHPPPLLIAADGTSQFLETGGLALGWPGDVVDPPVKVQMQRSETLVLYTDGLVEATRNIVEGFDQLQAAARAVVDYPANTVASALVRIALAAGERRDDTLVVTLRRRVAPAATGHRPLANLEHRFQPVPAAVPLARRLLADWLAHQPMDAAAAGDLLLVAGELCANAVAAGDPGVQVVLRASVEGDAIAIEVEDQGRGRPEAPLDIGGDPLAEHGRGLHIVRAVTDALETYRIGNRTIVRAVKREVVAVPD
jgi:serine phosphatase RsbU (regulator of sigma subunit)/anti-sigma regulatory factor (Ser/Thr protein kinase)